MEKYLSGKELSTDLETAFNELNQLISSLDEKQLNTVPFEGSWTAAQLGEHLAMSYNVIRTLKGNTAETERPVDEKIKDLRSRFLNFEIKMQALDFIIPPGGHIHKEPLLSQLKIKTAKIVEFVRTNDLTPTCLDFEFPGLGFLTRLEWAHFVLYHTQRHLRQLKNIIQL